MLVNEVLNSKKRNLKDLQTNNGINGFIPIIILNIVSSSRENSHINEVYMGIPVLYENVNITNNKLILPIDYFKLSKFYKNPIRFIIVNYEGQFV